MNKLCEKFLNWRIIILNEPYKSPATTGEIAQKTALKLQVSDCAFVDNALPHGEIDKKFDVFMKNDL